MRLDWRGDPPTIEPTDLPLETVPGISLERLFYSTFLGRDERVIAADKGFLMPFGFRATNLRSVSAPMSRTPQTLAARSPSRFGEFASSRGGRRRRFRH